MSLLEPSPETRAALEELGPAGGGACAARSLPLHDRKRLGALLRALEPRLTALALRMTRDPESARDVVQSGFEKVLRHGAGFAGGSRVSTWVHRIVANEALMWLRAERRRPGRPAPGGDPVDAELADPRPGPAEELLRREGARRLARGLAQLSREERGVLEECALAGQSYAEFAARRGLRPAAVKSRAFRARQRLGALLAEAPR